MGTYVLISGSLLPPGNLSNVWRHFGVSDLVGGDASGIRCVEVCDLLSIMRGIDPTLKNYLPPNVHNAKVEEP